MLSVFLVLITCGRLTGMFYPRVIVFNSLSFVLPLSDISSSDDRPRMTSQPVGLDTDLFNVLQNVIWSSVKERREELLE